MSRSRKHRYRFRSAYCRYKNICRLENNSRVIAEARYVATRLQGHLRVVVNSDERTQVIADLLEESGRLGAAERVRATLERNDESPSYVVRRLR
jgi:hypothetical protein